jgi:hypothetical protein
MQFDTCRKIIHSRFQIARKIPAANDRLKIKFGGALTPQKNNTIIVTIITFSVRVSSVGQHIKKILVWLM